MNSTLYIAFLRGYNTLDQEVWSMSDVIGTLDQLNAAWLRACKKAFADMPADVCRVELSLPCLYEGKRRPCSLHT